MEYPKIIAIAQKCKGFVYDDLLINLKNRTALSKYVTPQPDAVNLMFEDMVRGRDCARVGGKTLTGSVDLISAASTPVLKHGR